MSNLLALLQAARDEIAARMPSELIQVPDGEPFTPGPLGIIHNIGGPAPKAGDSAGYATVNTTGNWSGGIGLWRVQHMRWANNQEFSRVGALLAELDTFIAKNHLTES